MLIGNYSVLNKNPGRNLGGGSVGLGLGNNRSDFNKSSMSRGRFSHAAWSKKSGDPEGARPPYCWILPMQSGALVCRNVITGTGAFTASGALGRNLTAGLTGGGTLTGAGALIVQAAANLTGSGGITTASILAVLQATANLTGSGTLAGTADAIGHLEGDLAGTSTLTAPMYATGKLEGDITPFTDLSPEGLANAVWSSDIGTIVAALLRNKTVTDPDTGTMTVYAEDGTTPILTANIYEDADGNLPYSGSGVNRRDRLA